MSDRGNEQYRAGFEAGVRSVLESIDYEAAEDTYLGFIDETERSRLHADDFDEARRQARVVVRAALGSGGDDEAGSIPSVKGWEPAVTSSAPLRWSYDPTETRSPPASP